MLATNIAALVVIKKGGLEPQSLQQMYNTWSFFKVVAINGFLPITFTMTNLYVVGILSWYMIVLSLLTVALSIGTSTAVGRFSPSEQEMQNLANIAKSGGPQECEYRQPGVYCFSGISDGEYTDTSYTFSTVDADSSSILRFCLVVTVLLLGHKLNLHNKASIQRLRHFMIARLLSYSQMLWVFLLISPWRRIITCMHSTRQKTTLLHVTRVLKVMISIWKPSALIMLEAWLRAAALLCRQSRAWQLCATGSNFIYSNAKERIKALGWRGLAALAFRTGVCITIFTFYSNAFVMFLHDLAWFAKNDVYSKTWNFGQVVAITVWAPPICEFIHLEIRGMQRGFDHRLIPPYKVSRSSDVDNDVNRKVDAIEMENRGSVDLEQGKGPSCDVGSLQAHPTGPSEDDDSMTKISMRSSYEQDADNDLRDLPSGSPAIIIPLRDELPHEDDEEMLLPGLKLIGRASTFPRVPFGRATSP